LFWLVGWLIDCIFCTCLIQKKENEIEINHSMDTDTLLKQTLERAKWIRQTQKSALNTFLQQVAEQISFMERVGVTSIRICVPQFVNRVPLRRDKAFKKISKKLRKIGYSVKEEPNHVLIISWFMM
jgi:hypothetical protein